MRRLQKLTDAFNASQSAVKVKLVESGGLGGDTRRSTRPDSSTGDLPDIVQLQETDQQQMIDTGTVLPASVCAKADRYSFSDFLPRVISYFTVQGTQYAMPFNTSGPVFYYNKKAFTAAGLDPEARRPRPSTTLRAAAEKLKATGVPAPLGLKTDPIFLEQWTAMGNRLFANNGERSPVPRHQGGVQRADGTTGLRVDDGHGEGRSRHDQCGRRDRCRRQSARDPQRLARHDHRQQRRARAPSPRS